MDKSDLCGIVKFLPGILIIISFCTPLAINAEIIIRDFYPVNINQFTTEDSIQAEDILFNNLDILEITITTDYKTLTRDIGDEPEYHHGVISYTLPGLDTVIVIAGFKTRGEFRKMRINCDTPPLRIKFDRKNIRNTIFQGHDDLKLVTHCRKNREIYETYLLKEYLLYRLYNYITDFSYKVRLLKVTYRDIKGVVDPFTRFGFFIEGTKKMAKRNNTEEIETRGIPKENTDYDISNLFYLFQYMIGNTDWSITALHNVKMLVSNKSDYIPVPYDFDFSGVIGTPYALPDSALPIISVRQRCWRGPGRTQEELATTFEFFNEKKDEIYTMYRKFSYLNEKQINSILKYYDKFYTIINDSRKIKREFGQTCLRRMKIP
jgi:hypothetical protein